MRTPASINICTLKPSEATIDSSAIINQKGSSNLGIYEVIIITKEGQKMKIIEKRIASYRKREILISKYLQELCLRNWPIAKAGPLPIIHDIKDFKSHTSIYMQHYVGVANKTKKSTTYGSLLSNSLVIFSSYDLPLPAWNLFNKEVRSLTNPFHNIKSISRKDYLWLHLQVLHAIITYSTLTRSAPIVASHNDLSKHNIAISEISGVARMNVIDIGLMANNYAGADFHHVLRMSMKSKYWHKVYCIAVRKYSLATGFSPQAISCAAHLFGLMRLLSSCRRSITKKLGEEKIARQLEQARLLLSSLYEIPSKLSKEEK